MAHKKGQGSSRNGRDSNAQRLEPGTNVMRGRDDTLFATAEGHVQFKNRGRLGRFISILTA